MMKTNGVQTVSLVTGRRIVISKGVGKTTLEELKELGDKVMRCASMWKVQGWAYIADCSELSPVGTTENGEIVRMSKRFVEGNCKAFAFVYGKSIMLKIQAKKNTEMSGTGVLEGHFETQEEALEWLKNEVHI